MATHQFMGEKHGPLGFKIVAIGAFLGFQIHGMNCYIFIYRVDESDLFKLLFPSFFYNMYILHLVKYIPFHHEFNLFLCSL